MIKENQKEMNSESSQSGITSREDRKETIENSLGETQPVKSLLDEAKSALDKLEDKTSSSNLTIEDTIGLLKRLETEASNFDQSSGQIKFCQGEILNALKDQLQQLKGKKRFGWEHWAETNIKFMGKRKMQALMQLAKNKYLYPYAVLGLERLLKLLRAMPKDSNGSGPNPVATFLSGHNVTLLEDGELVSPELKARVDEIIAASKNGSRGQNGTRSITDKLHRSMARVEARISSILETRELADQVDLGKVTSLRDKLTELESSIRLN